MAHCKEDGKPEEPRRGKQKELPTFSLSIHAEQIIVISTASRSSPTQRAQRTLAAPLPSAVRARAETRRSTTSIRQRRKTRRSPRRSRQRRQSRRPTRTLSVRVRRVRKPREHRVEVLVRRLLLLMMLSLIVTSVVPLRLRVILVLRLLLLPRRNESSSSVEPVSLVGAERVTSLAWAEGLVSSEGVASERGAAKGIALNRTEGRGSSSWAKRSRTRHVRRQGLVVDTRITRSETLGQTLSRSVRLQSP